MACAMTFVVQLTAQTDAALQAYRNGEIQKAANLYQEAYAKTPDDVEAIIGLFFLNASVDGLPSNTELAAALLDVDPVPVTHLSAYEGSMFPLVVEKGDRKRVSKLFERAIADERLPATMREEIMSRYGSYEYVNGDPAGGMKRILSMVQLTNWSFAGPFPNLLGSGFDNDYGPLEHPEASATFAGEFQAPITWHELLHVTRGVEVRLANYIAADHALAFAQTFVDIPADGEYTLALALAGSAKVYVDDALVYSEDEERSTMLDGNKLRMRLKKGTHRVLLQLGAAERSSVDFFARFLDADGNPVELTSTATARPYKKATDIEAEVSHPEEIAIAQTAAERAGATLFEKFAYANLLLRAGRYLEVRNLVNELKQTDELTPYVVELQNVLYNIEDNEAGQEELKSKIRDARPNDESIIVERYQKAIELEDYNTAGKELDALEALVGENEQVLLLRMGIAFYREDIQEGLGHLARARKKYPASQTLMWMSYRVQAQMYNNPVAAKRVVRDYLRDYNLDAVRADLASVYASEGDDKEAISLYREMLEHLPYIPSYKESIYQSLVSAEKYKQAVEEIDALLLQAPDVASFHEARGDVLRLMKREDEALASFDRALELGPNNFSLRSSVRDLRNQRSPYSFLDSTSVAEVIAEFGSAYDDSDYPIAILADDVRRVVYDDGVSEARTVFVYKVLNDRGIDILKEYNLGNVQLFDAQIVKPNGTKIDAERNGYTVVFPKLAAGDYVYISFAQRTVNGGKLFGHFWEDYRLNAWYPVARARYQVLAPKTHNFAYKVTGQEVEPTIAEVDRYKRYTWNLEDPARIANEEYTPPTADMATVLHLSSIPDWQYVVDWYEELSASRTKGDYAVERAVAKIFPDGTDGLSEQERVQRIYEYIIANIAYSSLSFRQSAHVPQRPGKTLATQLGDCKDVSSLFVAMGREVGVEADLVLVDTRDNGEQHLVLPTMMFNHCIVRLRSTGEYLELTDKYLPYGSMSNTLAGSTALPIVTTGEQSTITRITPSDRRNGMHTYADVSFDGNDVKLRRRTKYFGDLASGKRHYYHNESEKDQEANVRRLVDNKIDKPFRLESFSFEGLDALTDTVVLESDISIEGAVSKLQSLKFFQLPWSVRNTAADFVSETDRTADLCLWKMTDVQVSHETVRVKLPEGASLVEKPGDITHGFGGLKYSLKFAMEGDELVVSRDFAMEEDTFSPADFAKVSDLFKQIAEADDQLIGFKVAP